MKPKYTVIIYTPQELNQASYIQTGLFELEHMGIIDLKVKLKVAKQSGRIGVNEGGENIRTNQLNPKVSYYKLIDHETNKRITFATDLYDHADQFSEHAFLNCDFVYKRSYESKYVKHLPLNFQEKLYKLGLTFKVYPDSKKIPKKLFWGIWLNGLVNSFKLDRLVFRKIMKSNQVQTNHWKGFNKGQKLSRYREYTIPKGLSLLFQTRCFKHENDIDVKEIHTQRYHLIHLLRQEFPKVFQGGFVPSPWVLSHYKDAVTNVPTAPELYLNALKEAKIVIYTRGLANSPAWKMAEYLSQAKVIIAEKLTTELPVPLNDKQVLWFHTDEELVSQIHKVLNDDNLCLELSAQARHYFETYVDPVKNVKRILELMLNHKIN